MIMKLEKLVILSVICLGFLAGMGLEGCKSCRRDQEEEKKEKETPFVGYNIQLPAGTDLKKLIDEINNKLGKQIDMNKHVRRCPCDSSLININYPDIDFSGHDKIVVKTREGQELEFPVTGEVKVNKNFVFEVNIERDVKQRNDSLRQMIGRMRAIEFNPNRNKTDLVRMAIFDSGIDNNLLSLDYVGVKAMPSSCIRLSAADSAKLIKNNKFLGLNFAPADPGGTYSVSDLEDRHPAHHGSRISYLAAEQFRQSADKGVELLTMKVLNSENKGDGYGIMCAMYHAKQLGAKIFNMSLGYYGPEDLLFKEYVTGLKSDKIWLVAAAGNAMQAFDSGTWVSNAPADRNLDLRNDNSKFYPAYFGRKGGLDHVLSVTTTDATSGAFTICSGQNYGKESVDLAVEAKSCLFSVEFYAGPGRQGTSYAAPVVAGWLGVQHGLDTKNKSAILGGAVVGPSLSAYTRSGKYVKPFRDAASFP